MYADDFIFAKNEKELETPIITIRICTQDVGIEFGIEKCTMIKRWEKRNKGKKHQNISGWWGNNKKQRELEAEAMKKLEKREREKRVLQKNKKTFRSQTQL